MAQSSSRDSTSGRWGLRIETDWGDFTVEFTRVGLSRLTFPDQRPDCAGEFSEREGPCFEPLNRGRRRESAPLSRTGTGLQQSSRSSVIAETEGADSHPSLSGAWGPLPNDAPAAVRRWCEWTRRALGAVLQGRPPTRLPPLDWTGATEFQREVWRGLLAIPLGQTLSYGGLASRLGHPRSARAVGAACGANPIPLLVPCHRVLAANGRLGGFSSGLDWKLRLLNLEADC